MSPTTEALQALRENFRAAQLRADIEGLVYDAHDRGTISKAELGLLRAQCKMVGLDTRPDIARRLAEMEACT